MLFKLLLILFSVITSLLILYQFKKKKISFISSLLAFAFIFAILIFAYNPNLSTEIANFFGVGRGVDFFMYASILLFAFLIFKLYIKINQLDRVLTDIVVDLAVKDVKNYKK